jgi:hypothetical protein
MTKEEFKKIAAAIFTSAKVKNNDVLMVDIHSSLRILAVACDEPVNYTINQEGNELRFIEENQK